MTNSPEYREHANDRQLDELFLAYRVSTDVDAVSPDFMPGIWQRIESRRRNSQVVERFARIFASATVAMAVIAGIFVSLEPSRPQEDTWVEALANHSLAQNASYYEPVRLSTVSETVEQPADK